jgi:hypothetical protein
MAYGIDSTLQDKVNAFRGQPQQLMQQYGQSQQLVDLLALQQIKSEKEAAARQIQMAMAQKQGQPTTIAQQREQEVMGLTRNEIAKQVQQGMPQQPQAPQQAPQQGPQGGGISALPAPNMQGMQNMAGGGIVAFAGTEGSDVPNPDDGAPENETEAEQYRRLQRAYLRARIAEASQGTMAADPGTGENALASAMASRNTPSVPGADKDIGSLVGTPDATGKAGVDVSQEAYRAMKAREREAKAASGNPVRDMRLRNMEKRQEEGIASLRAEAEGDLGNQGSAIPPTDEGSSPAGRFANENLSAAERWLSESQASGRKQQEREKAKNAVLAKFGGAADPMGLFQNQTDEERANAIKITDASNSMTTEQLKEVLSTGKMPSPTDSNVSPELALSLALGGKKTAPPAAVAPQGIAKLAADKAAPVTQAAPVTKAPPETGTDADTGEQTTTPAYSGPMGKGISSLTRPTVATVDREGIRKGIASEYDNMPGLAELNKQRTDVANQLAQVYAKQNDPERQRQEKIHAFLSGLSHGATAASGLGLASEGVAETGKAQEAAKVTQIKELQANVEVRAKELMEMGFKRSDAMAKAVEEAQKNAISLYGHDVTRYGDEMRDREALARLLQDKHTDTTRYADEYVKAARTRGDRSPESVLRQKAMLEFNTARANTAAGTQANAQNDKMVQFIEAEVTKREGKDTSTIGMTGPQRAAWRDAQRREIRDSMGLPGVPQAEAGAADGWGNMSVK